MTDIDAAQPLDVDELRALLDAATPGPWVATPNHRVLWPDSPEDPNGLEVASTFYPNAQFIAAARNQLPALLTDLAAAREEVGKLRGELAEALKAPAEIARRCALYRDRFLAGGDKGWGAAVWDSARKLAEEYATTPAEPQADSHPHYTGTYCIHGLHEQCKRTCKTCSAPCRCSCHTPAVPASAVTHVVSDWGGQHCRGCGKPWPCPNAPAEASGDGPRLCSDKAGFHEPHDWRSPEDLDVLIECPGIPDGGR